MQSDLSKLLINFVIDLLSVDKNFNEHVSNCTRLLPPDDDIPDKHVSDCARVLPSDDETLGEYVPECTRVIHSDDEIPGEYVTECTRLLPSDNETPGKHAFDSMDRCTVDELVKRDLRMFATWWKKQNHDMFWQQSRIINTGRERLIRSHSSARFCFELSGNSK